MARPIKNGLDYFPLDVDIDQDDKVAMIEAIHGPEGFSVVIKLLCKIYKESYFYEWTKREQLLFSKRVNVDINTLTDIINDCIKEGLFNKNVFEKYHVLTSKGIQKRYLEAIKRRKQVEFIRDYFLIDDIESIVGTSKIDVFLVNVDGNGINVNINTHSKGNNVEFSTQRKGKERKTEERKTEERNEPQKTPAVNPHNFYEQNFGNMNQKTASSISMWIDDLSEELVIEALKRSITKGYAYAQGIMKDWARDGVKNLDDVEKLDKKFNGRGKPQDKKLFKHEPSEFLKEQAFKNAEAMKNRQPIPDNDPDFPF